MGRPLRRRRQQGRRAQTHARRWSKHREGGDPSSSRTSRPAAPKYDAITLERGVTHDKEFEQWANKVWNFGAGLGAEVSLKDFRKDIIIELYNEAGQLADRLQGVSLLGLGVPGAARPRRERQRGRDRSTSSSRTKAGSADDEVAEPVRADDCRGGVSRARTFGCRRRSAMGSRCRRETASNGHAAARGSHPGEPRRRISRRSASARRDRRVLNVRERMFGRWLH